MYIIDGNNLAGKMRMLGEDSFDRRLLSLVMRWNAGRQVKATVVFDSGQLMGDQQQLDNFVRAVYVPKDGFYKNADDKIVELIRQNSLYPGETIILVTEDRELITRAEAEAKQSGQAIEMVSAGNFALKLAADPAVPDEDRDLSAEEIDDINSDLLRQWTGK